MTTLRTIWAILAASVLLAAGGCDPSDGSQCDPACENGLVCNTDTGKCHSPALEPFEGTLPGRSVRMEVAEDRAYLAVIDPAGAVLVGVADGAEPALFTLAELSRPQGRKLALAASAATVAVAWLGDDDRYRIATHTIGQRADRWRLLPPVEATDGNYRGSQHFGLSVDAGKIHLAFHDPQTQALEEISGPIDASAWHRSTIDDPNEQADETVCTAQQRRLTHRGLGFEPDVLTRAGTTYIAYQDGDCGDLRLATRLDGRWRVSVVDTGDFERDDSSALTRGDTGRFASLGIDSTGRLAVAYQDATRGQLVVAYDRGGRFVTELADAGLEVDAYSRERKHVVGGFASLIFDDQDIPWVAYLDSTTGRLRLAHRDEPFDLDGRWTQQTIDARPPTGFSAALSFSSARGRVVAAEHLRPVRGGIESRLEFLREEAF